MLTVYEKNIRNILKCQIFVEEKVEFLNSIDIENEEVMESGDYLRFRYSDKYFTLYSKYMEHTELYKKSLDQTKDYLFLFIGIADIKLILELLEYSTKGTRILIFEPNPYVFKYVIKNFDLTEIYDTNQVGIIFNFNDEKKLAQEIFSYASFGWENLAKNIRVFLLPNYYIYKDVGRRFVNDFVKALEIRIKMLGNSLEDMLNGLRNNYLNIDAIMMSCNLKDMENIYKDYPAIIVASGPSLDKNIKYLNDSMDKAFIIACDASLEACKKYSVKPDAIASIERDEPTYLYYYKDKKFDDDLVLVGPSVLWPKIYQEFNGKKLVTSKLNDGIENWWASHFPDFKFLCQGLSSAHIAYAIAEYAGCDPIILVGQDLAYTTKKKHSELTHTEFEGDNDTSGSDGEFYVEDVYGNLVLTDRVYNIFREWYEVQLMNDSKTTVIDATEGGAKIKGAKIMTLKASIDEYCKIPLPNHLHTYLTAKDPSMGERKSKYEEIIADVNKLIYILYNIKKRASDHYKTLEKIYYKEINDSLNEDQLRKIVLKIQKGDNIIEYLKKKEDLFSYYKQIIRQTIIFVKGLGNELTIMNVINNIKLQASLMNMIAGTSEQVINEFHKMIEFLNNKVNELNNSFGEE